MPEPYELEKLDLPALQKLLRVLDDIKRRYEFAEKTKEDWFAMGEYTTPGVTKNEFIFFIDNLKSRGYMEGFYQYTEYLRIGHNFHHFREEVAQEIHKRKTKLKLKTIDNEKPHYDLQNGILHVWGMKSKIKRYDIETPEHLILKYIFIDKGDLTREYDYSEIPLGELEFDKENGWKKYREAFRSINAKVSDDTHGLVEKFFIFNNRKLGSAHINPKYLDNHDKKLG